MNYEAIGAMWPILIGVMFGVIWLVRLEAKVLYLEREKKMVWIKLDAIQVTLTEVLISLGKIQGKLETKE